MTHYQIEDGDSLGKIASAFEGVSSSDLAKANPWIDNPDLIRPGWVIHIPEPAAVEPPIEPPTEPPVEPPLPTGFGAGVDGAALPIPAGAVQVTPSTVRAAIEDNPPGTNFEWLPGAYNIEQLPQKDGNWHYGQPADHLAVRAVGDVQFGSLSSGSKPKSGKFWLFRFLKDNGIANMTIEGYRGNNDNASAAPLRLSGSVRPRVHNVLFRDCYRSGFATGGVDGEYHHITSAFHGSYCKTGGGKNQKFFNCDFYSSGDNNLVARGKVPQVGVSDRGISKHNHADGIEHYNCYFHDINGWANGDWADGNVRGFLHEDCVFRNTTRFGVEHELTHGGVVRRSQFFNCGQLEDTQYPYRHAAIGVANGGQVLIEDCLVDGEGGGWNGIQLYQTNRDNTKPEYSSAMCGTVVRNNTIRNVRGYFVTSHCNHSKDGCNFHDDPSRLTIRDNNYEGANGFWERGAKTAAEWTALGYS